MIDDSPAKRSIQMQFHTCYFFLSHGNKLPISITHLYHFYDANLHPPTCRAQYHNVPSRSNFIENRLTANAGAEGGNLIMHLPSQGAGRISGDEGFALWFTLILNITSDLTLLKINLRVVTKAGVAGELTPFYSLCCLSVVTIRGCLWYIQK